MSCGFASHILHRTEKVSLYKVILNTEYSGSVPVYVQYESSSPRGSVQLRSFNNGVYIIVLDVNDNHIDHTHIHPLSYLKQLNPKTVNLDESYYENDILVNCYDYIDFIREYGFKFPYPDLYVLSGVNNLENAYWNGQYLTFGKGIYGSSYPLTSPCIIGHELTHALIQAGPKLDYYGESGSLNESFADVFGVMFEFWASERRSSIGWEIGSEIFWDHHSMRSFKDPNSCGFPASIHDPLCYNGHMDNNGVHINSSIINHLFYKLQALPTGDKKNTFRTFIKVFNKLKHNSKFNDFKRILLEYTTKEESEIVNDCL